MKHKSPITILVAFFFCSFLIVPSIYISATDESNKIISEGDWFEYVVLEASNTTNAFYGSWPPGLFYGNWSIEEGEKIQFLATLIQEGIRNCTLILGNYSFENIRDIDAAVALAFSIYPWNGGFIANASEWGYIEQQIQNTNTTQTVLNKYKHTINNTSAQYKVRIFNTTNYYGQRSLFHYHDGSGVLLKASTSYGNYSLEVSLVNTSFELETQQGIFSLNFPVFLIITSVVGLALIFKRFYKSK